MRVARARAPGGQRGEVSWIGLALLLAAAAAAYLAWVWVPVYWLHQEVEQVVRETGNAAIRSREDASLLAAMTEKIRALAGVEVAEPSGRVSRAPLIDLWPQDVTWERHGDRLRVAFSYTRDVVYPWLDRRQARTMELDLSLDTSRPDWGGR